MGRSNESIVHLAGIPGPGRLPIFPENAGNSLMTPTALLARSRTRNLTPAWLNSFRVGLCCVARRSRASWRP